MKNISTPLIICAISILAVPAWSADYSSNGSGNWMLETNWSPTFPTPGQGPYVGESGGGIGLDNATIGSGHTITIHGPYHGGGDFTVRGSTVTVAGGTLQQSTIGQWIRVGQTDAGTVNSYFFEHNRTTDEFLFHYKVEGAVPEPGTMGLVVLGILFMQGMRKQRMSS